MDIIKNINEMLNLREIKIFIVVSMIIYISIIDLPLSSLDKIIYSIFNSFLGQLIILTIIYYYIENEDYGISLLFVILYCILLKIKMSNNIIDTYSKTNQNEKNNLIEEDIDLNTEDLISNKIEESGIETENTLDDEVNIIQQNDLDNDEYETEIIENKKISGGDNINKKNLMKNLEMKSLTKLINYENEKKTSMAEYDKLLNEIKKKEKQLDINEEKYLNILDNNLDNNDLDLLNLKKKNKKEELKLLIERNKKYDKNGDGILDWKDNQENIEKWTKEIDNWLPTTEMLDEWNQVYENMISVKKTDKKEDNKSKIKKDIKKDIKGGDLSDDEKFLNKLENHQSVLKKEQEILNKLMK